MTGLTTHNMDRAQNYYASRPVRRERATYARYQRMATHYWELQKRLESLPITSTYEYLFPSKEHVEFI